MAGRCKVEGSHRALPASFQVDVFFPLFFSLPQEGMKETFGPSSGVSCRSTLEPSARALCCPRPMTDPLGTKL